MPEGDLIMVIENVLGVRVCFDSLSIFVYEFEFCSFRVYE
jgi:hypothetical protein